MFEQRVLYYLQQYLGQYVSGLDANALRISVFAGDVVLNNLQLRPEALSKLDLPLTVQAGLLGSLKLKIPWRSLGQSPVIVEIDSIYLLAGPKRETQLSTSQPDARSAVQAAIQAKQRSVNDQELAWVQRHLHADAKVETDDSGGGFLRAMIDTIIGNLQFSITNIHVRYEDDVNVPECPIAMGFTLQKLSAHTIDEAGREVFVHKNALELLRKASELKRLAIYLDVHATFWKAKQPWAQLQRSDWDDLFKSSISANSSDSTAMAAIGTHTYVLKPIDGQLLYTRRGRNARHDDSQPIQEATINLRSISLHLSHTQFQSLHKVSGEFATYAARAHHWQHRPQQPPADAASAAAWWRYAGSAVRDLLPKSMHWADIQEVGWMRRKYIPAYVECLQQNQLGGNEETRKMDESLPEPTILLFRRLAHTQVERNKRQAAAAADSQKRTAGGGSWFGWLTGSGTATAQKPEPAGEDGGGELSDEERAHLRNLVTEQEDAMDVGQESPNSVTFKVAASVEEAAVVLDSEEGEVLRGAMEGLSCGVTFFFKTKAFDVSILGVGLTSPEGVFVRSSRPLKHLASTGSASIEITEDQSLEESESKTRAEVVSSNVSGDDENDDHSRALQLRFVQNPQDDSADYVINLQLSSSYIYYSAALVARVRAFFHVEEVPDLTIVAAQAAVQVDRARNAARRQMQAALNTKPKLQLYVALVAPKVAIPLAVQDDKDASMTVALDLGRFVLQSGSKSMQSKLSDEEAAVYLPFELAVRNISAYVIDGAFSWALLGSRLPLVLQANGRDPNGSSVVVPILERCEVSANLHVAKMDHATLPPARLGVTIPKLRLYISPARLQRIMRVLHEVLSGLAGQDEGTAKVPEAWRERAEKEGQLSVLEWGGLGYAAQWVPRHCVLYRSSLHFLQSSISDDILDTIPLRQDRRIADLPPEYIGDVEHCLVIGSHDSDLSKIAEDSTALILRFSTDSEAANWKAAMKRSRQALVALAGTGNSATDSGDLADWGAPAPAEGNGNAPPTDPTKPMLTVQASLGELAIFVCGRVAKDWWPDTEGNAAQVTSSGEASLISIDDESPLICVRASSATSGVEFGAERTSICVALGAFEIQDLLVGSRSKHSHLARSFQPLSALQAHEQASGSDDDEFQDATERQSSAAISLGHSQSSVSATSVYLDPSESMQTPSEDEESLVGAKGVPAGGMPNTETCQAWTLDFQTIKVDSSLYQGVDTDMSMKLTSLWFFCNRPTVGALIEFGTDMAAALTDPSAAEGSTDTDNAVAPANGDLTKLEKAARDEQRFVVGGGRDRTVFRLAVAMSHLEAIFNYEASNALPLGAISIQDVRTDVKVHPGTIVISAGLGDVTAVDGSLDKDNPYCKACRPREGAATSLVQINIASHSAEEERDIKRVPDGVEFWSVNVDITQLEVVFLNRFLQEILGYLAVLLALRPEAKHQLVVEDASAEEHHGHLATLEHAQAAAAAAMVLQLDVKMEAPVITMPRCSNSDDKVVADLGSLQLSNVVKWVGHNRPDQATVLLDTLTLTMRGLNAKVDAEGHAGDNIIREYHEGTQVVLRRALQDDEGQLPALEVAISLPAIKATLSDQEYQLITSVTGANLGEELHLCDEARWMQAKHAPATEVDSISEDPRSKTDRLRQGLKAARPEVQASSASDSSRAKVKAVVNIGKVELEMLYTPPETRQVEPLAVFKVTDLWVSYSALEDGCSGVQLSIPHVVGSDARPGVLPEHTLVISAGSQDSASLLRDSAREPAQSDSLDSIEHVDVSSRHLTPSFVTLQLDQSPGKASLAVRLQQPQLVAEVGFILAVAKFIYPSLPVAGVAPIPYRSFDLYLEDPLTDAHEDLYLSPHSRLLADRPEVDDYIYDGHNLLLVLPDDISAEEQLPLIIVGAGKTLRLRNVTISGASSLSACLHLGPGAQFIAESDDYVKKVDKDPRALRHSKSSITSSIPRLGSTSQKWQSVASKVVAANALSGGRLSENASASLPASASEFSMDLVALDVGLRFVEIEAADSEQDRAKMPAGAPGPSAGRAPNSMRMLAAHFDAAAGFCANGDGTSSHATLQGLRVESQVILNNEATEQQLTSVTQGQHRVQGSLLEPCCLQAKVCQTGQTGAATEVDIEVSPLRLNVSVDVVELIVSLQASVLGPFSPPRADRPLARCTAYEKLVQGPSNAEPTSGGAPHGTSTTPSITFWRPMPPAGYAVLGHCVTIGEEQPAFQAVAIAVNSGLVDFPRGFDEVWTSEHLTVWQPQPPNGFAAVGCVVTDGKAPPPLSSVVCAHRQVLVRSSAGSCLPLCAGPDSNNTANIWCADNAAATFFVAPSASEGVQDDMVDLRDVLGDTPAALNELFRTPIVPVQQPPPAPSTGAAIGSLSRRSTSRELRRTSTELYAYPLGGTQPLANRSRRATTPQLRIFRWFLQDREALQRSESSARLKVSSVDFRRMWLDKGSPNPTREGLSLWRPTPPPGYFSLGDCVTKGYDPPRQAMVIQGAEAGSEQPLLAQPRDFQLVWSEQAAPRDNGIAIWRPVPEEGYVAMGHVCSVGAVSKPSRNVVRCVRADQVMAADMVRQRPVARLAKSGRREALSMWLVDDKLGTFIACVAMQPPQQSELWQLRMLHRSVTESTTAEDSQKAGLKLTVKAAGARLVMRDVLRRPLAEMEVGQLVAAVNRPCADVSQVTVALRLSLWSYNTALTAWEPVVEPWGVLLKLDSNKGKEVMYGTDLGTRLGVTSTSDAMHVTIAYAAVSHIIDAFLEWKGLQKGAKEAYRRQLAAADSASAFTVITNRLGVPSRLELDHGTHTKEVNLGIGVGQPVLQPVAVAPMRSTNAPGIPPDAFPPQLLLVDVLSATAVPSEELADAASAEPLEQRQLLLSVWPSPTRAQKPASEAHTRAVASNNDNCVSWQERFVMEAPPQQDGAGVSFRLQVDSGSEGTSTELGTAHVTLDTTFWQHSDSGNHMQRKLKLQIGSGQQAWEVNVRITLGGERYHKETEVTDAWCADRTTTGSRALRVGRSEWLQVGTVGRKTFGTNGQTGSEAATVIPVRLNKDSGVAFETSFENGIRREMLRSLAQVANATTVPLEVAVTDFAETPSTPQAIAPAGRRTQEVANVRSAVVFENERYMPMRGWSADNLLPTDRRRFSGPNRSDTNAFPTVSLDQGWQWEGAWEVETSGCTDNDGWAYALNWPLMRYPPTPGMAKKGFTDCVRRRRWVRRMKQTDLPTPQASSGEGTASASSDNSSLEVVGVVQPGDKLPLPLSFSAPGRQLKVRPVAQGEQSGATHNWSLGTSQGRHAVKLDSLSDGLTRLISCHKLQGSDTGASTSATTQGDSAMWLSMTVEGEVFDEVGQPSLQPLTDWRIVIAPPLVIESTLPIAGQLIVWEFPESGQDAATAVHSGHCGSGQRIEVYSADMRRRVAMQFYPDEYEWAEQAAVTISEGFAGHEAGFNGRRALPNRFLVQKHGSKQAVYLTREISNAWTLAQAQARQDNQQDKEAALDPGTVVASGSALLVRLLAPAWIYNATSLSISAVVLQDVPSASRGPTPSQESTSGERQRNSRALLNAASAMAELRVLESTQAARQNPVSRQHLPPGALDLISFPLSATLAAKDGQTRSESTKSYSISFQVEGSGWTMPLSLGGADIMSATGSGGNGASDGATNKPVLLRLYTADRLKAYEVVVRVELADDVFSRTLAVRLEPRFTVTNLTGHPLQLAQLARDTAMAEARRSQKVLQQAQGSRHGSSPDLRPPVSTDASSSTQMAGRGSGSFSLARMSPNARKRLEAAANAQTSAEYLDLTTMQELQPGVFRLALDWNTSCLAAQALCLRLGSGDGVTIGSASDEDLSAWSAPLDTALRGGAVCHVTIPAYTNGASIHGEGEIGAGGQGVRVRRSLPLLSGGKAAILRYHLRAVSPGCASLVLEAITEQSPYVLENRTAHQLQFRPVVPAELQTRTPPYQLLPPFSAAGYAAPTPADLQQVEIRVSTSSSDAQSQQYTLKTPDSLSNAKTDSLQANGTLPVIELSDQHKRIQPALADVEAETVTAAGLSGPGVGGAMGARGGVHALRFLPGLAREYGHFTEVHDTTTHSLALQLYIGHADVSVVDHLPEELLNLTVSGLRVEYDSGIGVGGTFASFRVGIQNLQLDDQMPFTRFPVAIAATEEQVQVHDQADPETEAPPLALLTLVSQPGLPRRQVYYPHIAFRFSRVLQVSVSETLLWRTFSLIRRLDLARLSDSTAQSGSADGSVQSASQDVPIQVRLVSLGDIQAKVSFRGDVNSRPKWAARMLSLGLNLADFEGVPIRLTGMEVQDATMLWSVFIREIANVVKAQLVGVAFKFMANFGVLAGASGILAGVSAGVASLGLDNNFANERITKRQGRSIGGVREGLTEGGEAFGKGLLSGVTGLVSKPMAGAQSKGVAGFVKGVGKGLVGAVAAPVSGGLDFWSSAMEGLDASKESLLGRPRAGTLLARHRLPRTIGGDFKLLPFIRDGSEREARVEEVGQALLWFTGEVSTGGGARGVVPFLGLKRRQSRGADAYEDHFLLPDGRVTILTSQAMLLVVAPSFASLHRKAETGSGVTDMRDIPTAALTWRVQWDDLLALEPYSSSSAASSGGGRDRLVVHRKGRPPSSRDGSQQEQLAEHMHCYPTTSMAEEIRAVAFRVAAKYYGEPRRQHAKWKKRHSGPQPGAQIQGLEKQQLPPSALSMDYRLLWRAPSSGPQPQPSIWRPICAPGYLPAGDVLSVGFDPPSQPVRTFKAEWGQQRQQGGHVPVASPLDYHLVWRDTGRSSATIWEPVPPRGYTALGAVVVAAAEMPDTSDVACVRQSLTKRVRLFDTASWRWEPAVLSAAVNLQRLRPYEPQTWRCSLWQVDNAESSFIANRSLNQPPAEAAAEVTGELASNSS